MKIGITSLGCPRNLVDSEIILGSLKKAGFKISDIEDGVDVCIINTCAFLESAREESIDVILQAAQLKKEGKIKNLVVCGCLPQACKSKLLKDIPEIDLLLGTSDYDKIAGLVKNIAKAKGTQLVSSDLNYIYDENSPRFLLTPKHYSYVKIAEGCSNFCSYCIIPRLRGLFRSRPIESIVEEVRKLSADGRLKEIDIIGQDTTLFGMDRYGRLALPELLEKIAGVKNNVKWIRILYTHPAHYTDRLIRTIRGEKKICKYLDLPVQHASDKILKLMNRGTTKKDIITLIDKLRKNIPGLVLRTSIIVGFPDESDREFKELLDFVRQIRFERLGAFIYSKEANTRAAKLGGQVPDKIKSQRFDSIMKLQQSLSCELNESYMGKTMDILIDEKVEGQANKYLGRSVGDAPEVDGTVYVTGSNLKVGEFYKTRITDALEYDLVGEVL